MGFKQFIIDFFNPNGSGYYQDDTGYEGIDYKKFNDEPLAAHWATVVFGILLLLLSIFSIIYFKKFWINLLNNKKVSKRIGICYLLIYPLYYILQYLYFYLEIKGKPEENLNLGVGLWFLPLNISQITHIIYAF
ncbi:MAG: hypothetical protein E7Y34_01475, partial [Mycoplasma sp.]|nr:hypothetical protein [Mycoplasma sp.]